jgi:hypothetical protein
MCGDRWLETGSPWEGDEMTDKIRAALVAYKDLAHGSLFADEEKQADEALREYDARATPALPQDEGMAIVPVELVEAVANIGNDFGYGRYEVEERFVKMAQSMLAAAKEKGE